MFPCLLASENIVAENFFSSMFSVFLSNDVSLFPINVSTSGNIVAGTKFASEQAIFSILAAQTMFIYKLSYIFFSHE